MSPTETSSRVNFITKNHNGCKEILFPLNNRTKIPGNNGCIYSLALLQATSAQTTSLVAAAEAARSSLEISELAQKAQDISVKRALWALQTIKVAAKAEEVAVNAIQTMFM